MPRIASVSMKLGVMVGALFALAIMAGNTEGASTSALEPPKVRVVYLVPLDKTANDAHREALERAFIHLQGWYYDALGNGTTFRLHEPVVEVVQTGHESDWYFTNTTAGQLCVACNVSSDGFNLTVGFDGDPENIWIFVLGADEGSQGGCNMGGGTTHQGGMATLCGALLPHLAGLVIGSGMIRSIGPFGHELGHTFMLVHPPPEDDTAQADGPLMGSVGEYPLSILLEQDKEILRNSPFFQPFSASGNYRHVEARMFNGTGTPDIGRVGLFVNGEYLMQVDSSAAETGVIETRRVDISPWVSPGHNSIRFTFFSSSSSFTYGFELYVDGGLVFEAKCGEALVSPCSESTGGTGWQVRFDETVVLDITPPTSTPTPSLSPTPTITPPTPTPSPTDAPATQVAWGDANCSGSANPVDSLLTLRHDAGLSANTGSCPEMGVVVDVQNASPHPWGDVDCGGDVTPVDSLKLLRYDAGLSVAQEASCPVIGSEVLVAE